MVTAGGGYGLKLADTKLRDHVPIKSEVSNAIEGSVLTRSSS